MRHFCDTLPFFHSHESSNRHLNQLEFSQSASIKAASFTLYIMIIVKYIDDYAVIPAFMILTFLQDAITGNDTGEIKLKLAISH